jgi:hypothetical protein
MLVIMALVTTLLTLPLLRRLLTEEDLRHAELPLAREPAKR